MIAAAYRRVQEIDHGRTGSSVRKFRLRRGRSLRAVARELGWSPTYLSDLERGKRRWSQALLARINEVLQ